MKTKLFSQTPAAILLLLVSLTALSQPAPQINPTAGLPVRAGAQAINPATGLPAPAGGGGLGLPTLVGGGGLGLAAQTGAAPTIDPTTGLPLPPTAFVEPQWIDPNWNDPDIVLTNVFYNDLPLSEVAKDLRERFKNYFDILPLPQWGNNDWGTIPIQLQLRGVQPSQVFNAMNLVFENDRTPLRWELKKPPGGRPWALLRVLPEGAPQPEPPLQNNWPETHRMVYFVGNLLGDEKSGGMTMEQIVKTISDVWPADFGKPEGIIHFHKEAQLLVVNGTRDQIDFIQQTLAALRQKAIAAHGPYMGRSQFPRGFVGSGQLGNDQQTNSVGDQ